jgi:uncharacterized protein (DUF4415 family)
VEAAPSLPRLPGIALQRPFTYPEDAKTEAELAADVASDEAWDGVPHDWVSQAAVAVRALRRPRENKRQVTMRFDSDVLDYFRRQGRGWQGRMNAVPRSFVERHQ